MHLCSDHGEGEHPLLHDEVEHSLHLACLGLPHLLGQAHHRVLPQEVRHLGVPIPNLHREGGLLTCTGGLLV